MVQDFDCIDDNTQYDCIVSMTTFHHLSLDTALPKIRKMLKPNGILMVLDLYKKRGIMDLLLEIVAFPTNIIMKRLMNGPREILKILKLEVGGIE
jgi:2-polyprenyl-3-methyl-5-hydroxy-6-metoxy-1,4-benzoquinol methylase